MEFNRFLWDLYRDSKDGRIAIERDVAGHLAATQQLRETSSFTHIMGFFEESNDDLVEDVVLEPEAVNLRELIAEYAAEHTVTNMCEAEQLFTSIADNAVVWSFEGDEGKNIWGGFGGGKLNATLYGDIFGSIAGLSAGLHATYPEFFTPYLFATRFDKFSKLCQSFNIRLPEVPGKLKKCERALYYLAINRSLYDFRKRHELSPQELNAFLYDFAPKSLVPRPDGELPRPSRIWFSIGGVENNGDFMWLDAADEKSVSHWQGNLETRRGDIILLWCASPRSYLHSVWRALDEGFNDPFFYYYSTIRVGQPIKITPIPFAEFSKHPLLGKKSSVRAHFQGASGTPFTVEEYAAIIDLLRKQGFDPSQLPQSPVAEEFYNAQLGNERAVETELVEPLLRKLGFTENDWIRQFPVRMGRGERNYPDYVFGADPRPGEESAVALIECKLDISTNKELKETFVQAKSYGLRLRAIVLALAARRGLWIFRQREDGFSIEHFTFKTWNELSHPDVLHEVSLVFGKRAIDNLIEQRSHTRKK